VTNLLSIQSAITGEEVSSLEKRFEGQGYGAFKEAVAETVVETLQPVREKYLSLVEDKPYLESVLKDGAAAAQKTAFRILSKVYRKIGFVERPR
jgi:tryptophanyl-tRNA synthetase